MSHGTYGTDRRYPFTAATFASCGVPNNYAATQGFGADTQEKVDAAGPVTVNYVPGATQ
jgi:hypothetical protein